MAFKAKQVVHSEQYGPVGIAADGAVATRVGGDWYTRADAPQLADGETVVGASWSPQMGIVLATSRGRVLTHNLGHTAEWRSDE